jgi:DNA-binding CsgD family transcriptional regulator
LKSHLRFSDVTRRLTDAWLNNSGKSVPAELICKPVEALLRINMVLLVVDMRPEKPQEWHLRFIRSYGIPTTLFDARELQQARCLSGFSEWASVEQHVVGACRKAVAFGRPEFSRFNEKIHDVRIVCDRLILPDPSGAGRWCIALTEVLMISSIGRAARLDDTDLAILQLLREGLPAREIGSALGLSARTIEHRVEKMKARTGVNAIVRLLAAAD